MDFAQLKRFIAVVEGGSFGKAADNLSLSQPGLSKSIHQLEAHFGEHLLVVREDSCLAIGVFLVE